MVGCKWKISTASRFWGEDTLERYCHTHNPRSSYLKNGTFYLVTLGCIHWNVLQRKTKSPSSSSLFSSVWCSQPSHCVAPKSFPLPQGLAGRVQEVRQTVCHQSLEERGRRDAWWSGQVREHSEWIQTYTTGWGDQIERLAVAFHLKYTIIIIIYVFFCACSFVCTCLWF